MPTAARVWEAEELRKTPAMVLDDALRWAPAVSLFRRTSSRDSHPTAQGLNLRGLAPSGVSRALVLVDGVPMNDPFGGWVYWDRVPMLALERVEVAPGGGSAPYGSQALGGVVQLVTRQRLATDMELQVLGGSDATTRFGIAVGSSGDRASIVGSAQIFNTGGYITTTPEERGAVDTEVGSSHQAARIRVDLPAGIALHFEGLHESRRNGTPLQRNETSLGGANASWQGTNAAGTGGWRIHGFGRSQTFDSSFSSIAADRNSERLVLVQRVPSTDFGAGGMGWHGLGDAATLSFGGDWRRVSGRSEELVVIPDFTRERGGVQHLGGGFAAADWAATDSLTINLGARVDGWNQEPIETDGEGRGESTFSPRGGVAWRPAPGTTLRAAAYRAFRAPTLNELYRQFRVGNVITRENPDLVQERLHGAEVGGGWSGAIGEGPARLTLETTFYWNRLEDAVINATERTTPTLIFRRRQNLGAATVRGLEVDGRVDVGREWSFVVSYAWLDATILDTGAASAESLEGNRLPQVPNYRVRGSLWYRSPRGWAGILSVAGIGEQFEDDLNQLPLASAVTVDASLEIPLIDEIGLTVRAENLFDENVEARRTPVLGYGAPRLLYAGVTLGWPER